ncbi:C40 family peptidase [Pseudonocardia bannensis]|uniref:C40 family peptidase n=1 Tax=Pseudonocardia bannensis TaxID=630973 RepID=A0A848DI44_9PSEU|nr:NlpC/P60 family protein [Pseudonocardia bannensis]NMH92171.1 C40 family peptidase [Pseudonocardia bannensis]
MRAGRAIVVLVLIALLGGTSTALAQPPSPPPPPNPSDRELQASRDAIDRRAGALGRLTAQLADLDSQADDLQAALAAQRETASAALADLDTAQAAAAEASRRADAARVETQAATVAIDDARRRLDEFAASTYQQGLDAGALGLLTAATSPEDLVARAELRDVIARSQLAAQDGLERARVDKANADSRARAALEEARTREAEAAAAKAAADDAVAQAEDAARAQAAQLAQVSAQRADVQRQLDAAAASDAGLRAQRDRYEGWQRQQAAQRAAEERAAQRAAAARLESGGRDDRRAPAVRAGSGAVQRVIDRAMSQIGVQYVWGGGNGRGPTTGIPDGLGSPLDRIGFDCSGLMLYAFNGVGVSLPRVSRNQFNAGRKVPISELRPGDMVFYKNGGAPIHHVAMFIGNGKMIEAPYTGANVRVVPLRTKGLLPQATRML